MYSTSTGPEHAPNQRLFPCIPARPGQSMLPTNRYFHVYSSSTSQNMLLTEVKARRPYCTWIKRRSEEKGHPVRDQQQQARELRVCIERWKASGIRGPTAVTKNTQRRSSTKDLSAAPTPTCLSLNTKRKSTRAGTDERTDTSAGLPRGRVESSSIASILNPETGPCRPRTSTRFAFSFSAARLTSFQWPRQLQ